MLDSRVRLRTARCIRRTPLDVSQLISLSLLLHWYLSLLSFLAPGRYLKKPQDAVPGRVFHISLFAQLFPSFTLNGVEGPAQSFLPPLKTQYKQLRTLSSPGVPHLVAHYPIQIKRCGRSFHRPHPFVQLFFDEKSLSPSRKRNYRLSRGDAFCSAAISSCAEDGALTSGSVMIFSALVEWPYSL
jgi:hypothetical protein